MTRNESGSDEASSQDEPKLESLGKMKQRHNQEKKDLKQQSKSKDKKQAKAKIKDLEAELKARHEKELEDRESVIAADNPPDEPIVPVVKGPSKKQRQHERRLAAEAESKRKLDEELKDVIDYRQIECEKLESKLTPLNLTIMDIRPDGHCLYHAIAHQLKLCGISVPEPGYIHLRKQAADYIRTHPDNFLPFLLNDEGELMTSEEFARHCDSIASVHEVLWGGQPEISALASVYKCQIMVYSADADPIVMMGAQIPDDCITLRLSFHKHILMGNHYNSVVCV